ncbi:MAG: F0F1 ATP synthase subunit alpha [Sedimentisphaerales bacterium]|nr:F0F1 ATP synthase subunit alpha [Sedimentisphaerales bacterium]
MKFKVEEITSVIKQEIAQFQSELDVSDVGRVLEIGDGIARIYGLNNAMAGELLQFENGEYGQVFNLEGDSIGAVVYGNYLGIKEGDEVRGMGELLSIPVGREMLGRVVNPLGLPLDGGAEITTKLRKPLEMIAPGIAERQPVVEPLQTGIKAIDSMIPIGRGQRELIIGDRKTGKTALAIDAIINQKNKDVVCVYVAIGQKESTVARVVEILREHDAMDYTIVVNASAADPAPMQYIAPYAGVTLAEYFMYEENCDTLCVYDDLTKQAQAYRQVSLLLRRPPGREAYPGDVFYLHSRLLERAVKLSDDMGGGSLTALPIIETLEGEVSAYIPTNVISITDGQIYLRPDLFFAGVRPAIDVGISVSRVGGKAQVKAMKDIAGMLRLDLASFRELEAFSQLGTDIDKATQAQLDRGRRMVEILKQPQYQPMDVFDQVVSLFVGISGLLDDVDVHHIAVFEKQMHEYLKANNSELLTELRSRGEMSDEFKSRLTAAIREFKRTETM